MPPTSVLVILCMHVCCVYLPAGDTSSPHPLAATWRTGSSCPNWPEQVLRAVAAQLRPCHLSQPPLPPQNCSGSQSCSTSPPPAPFPPVFSNLSSPSLNWKGRGLGPPLCVSQVDSHCARVRIQGSLTPTVKYSCPGSDTRNPSNNSLARASSHLPSGDRIGGQEVQFSHAFPSQGDRNIY